jgi:P-type E1-E2 ATPase
MIEVNIPGRGDFKLEHLVLDVNGTLCTDGRLLDGVAPRLAALKNRLTPHLLTADTYGRQDQIDRLLDLKAVRLRPGDEARQKADYVRGLGAAQVMALGQGANDAEMLKAAALGVAVLGDEGLAIEALLQADLLMPSICAALELLEAPTRLVATLRR